MSQELDNKVKDYEEALKNFGKNLTEIINLGFHHSVQENNYDEFIKQLEETVAEELVDEKKAETFDQVIKALNKIKGTKNDSKLK